ncbi:MAG TPA: DUF2142 domain-containing protein [Candidatus Saccharimonadales bacterium]|nr:DUF2142 domain-containing protein [Candidatus Saccharimonadales bacterium]
MAELVKRFKRPELFFLSCAALFGFLMVVLTPPMQTYDEQDHFFRAYQLSTFNLRPDIVSEGPGISPSQAPGGNLPVNVAKMGYGYLYSVRLDVNHTSHYKLGVLKNNFKNLAWLKVDNNQKQAAYFPGAGAYSPISYLPQIVAIWLGRLAHTPILWFFYLGRIFNLAAWIALVYFAIKLLPVGRWLMVAIALLPVSLFQAATFSADAMTNGLTFLVVALFCYLLAQKEVSRKDLIITLAATGALSLCKSGFWPLALLFWLIPIRNFGSSKKYLLSNLSITGLSLALFGLWYSLVKFVIPYMAAVQRAGETINYQQQVKYIEGHPFSFVVVLWHEYFNSTMIGVLKYGVGILGWGEASIGLAGFLLIILVLVLGILMAVTEKNNSNLKWPQRLGSLIIAAGLVLMMSISLYAAFTPLHSRSIDGLQGRYFIPYIALLVPVFGGVLYKWRSKLAAVNRYTLVMPTAILILMCLSVAAIVGRYY